MVPSQCPSCPRVVRDRSRRPCPQFRSERESARGLEVAMRTGGRAATSILVIWNSAMTIREKVLSATATPEERHRGSRLASWANLFARTSTPNWNARFATLQGRGDVPEKSAREDFRDGLSVPRRPQQAGAPLRENCRNLVGILFADEAGRAPPGPSEA